MLIVLFEELNLHILLFQEKLRCTHCKADLAKYSLAPLYLLYRKGFCYIHSFYEGPKCHGRKLVKGVGVCHVCCEAMSWTVNIWIKWGECCILNDVMCAVG